MLKIILFMLFLVTIFNIKLNFSSFYLIFLTSGLGFLILICDFFKNFKINFQLFQLLNFIFLVPLSWFLFCVLFNQFLNFDYFKEIVMYQTLTFFSAYSTIYIYFKIYNKNHIDNLIYYLVLSVLTQQILSVLSFNFVWIKNILDIIFLNSIIIDTSGFESGRIIGVWTQFFGAGTIYSIILIFCAFYIVKNNFKNINLVLLSMMVILVLGLFSSRTTLIGFIVSTLYLLSYYKGFKKILILVSFLTLVFLIFDEYAYSYYSQEGVFKYAFDFIVNFKNSQASDSTGELFLMFENIPNNIKTYMVGDILWRTENGYYKNVDIGLYRIVYASGIIGLILFFLSNFIYFFIEKQKFFDFRFLFFLTLLFFVLNTKGVASFAPFIYIFCIFHIFLKKIDCEAFRMRGF